MNKAKDVKWEEIATGMRASFSVQLSEQKVNSFLQLSGDYNPLHADASYASTTKFGKRVVPGMLLASFLSRLVGMSLPGKKALYMSQQLNFKKPAFINDKVEISGEVVRISPRLKLITINMQIRNGVNEVLAEGEGQVLYL